MKTYITFHVAYLNKKIKTEIPDIKRIDVPTFILNKKGNKIHLNTVKIEQLLANRLRKQGVLDYEICLVNGKLMQMYYDAMLKIVERRNKKKYLRHLGIIQNASSKRFINKINLDFESVFHVTHHNNQMYQ